MLRVAWTVDVSETVVKNACIKSGLLGAGEAGKPEENDKPEEPERTDLDSLADEVDDEVIMEPTDSDPDIIVERLINETVDLENNSESDYDEETGIPFPVTPPSAEARKMIDQVKAKIIAAHGEVPDSLLDIENRINHIPLRQATLG